MSQGSRNPRSPRLILCVVTISKCGPARKRPPAVRFFPATTTELPAQSATQIHQTQCATGVFAKFTFEVFFFGLRHYFNAVAFQLWNRTCPIKRSSLGVDSKPSEEKLHYSPLLLGRLCVWAIVYSVSDSPQTSWAIRSFQNENAKSPKVRKTLKMPRHCFADFGALSKPWAFVRACRKLFFFALSVLVYAFLNMGSLGISTVNFCFFLWLFVVVSGC